MRGLTLEIGAPEKPAMTRYTPQVDFEYWTSLVGSVRSVGLVISAATNVRKTRSTFLGVRYVSMHNALYLVEKAEPT